MLAEIAVAVVWSISIGAIAGIHQKRKEEKKAKEKEEIIKEVEERLKKKEEMLNAINQHSGNEE